MNSVTETGVKYQGKDVRKEYLERTGKLKRGNPVNES